MSKLAVLFNNQGYPLGAFCVDPGSGGERLLPFVEIACSLMNLHVGVSNEDNTVTVVPTRVREEVAAFVQQRTGIEPLEQLKSPPRG